MANLDRSKKALVRVALVSGSTIATLVGAQTVATIDQTARLNDAIPAATEAAPAPTATMQPTAQPTALIFHQAPSVVLLRTPQSPTTNTRSVNSAPVIAPPAAQMILPPNPQAISGPAPVIVQQQQQQAPVASQSSR